MYFHESKNWCDSDWQSYLESIVIKDGIVVAPEHNISKCGICGSPGKQISESDPSPARFNEGAVHYKAICSNEECEKVKCNIWDIHPFEAAMRFTNPEHFRLKDND